MNEWKDEMDKRMEGRNGGQIWMHELIEGEGGLRQIDRTDK